MVESDATQSNLSILGDFMPLDPQKYNPPPRRAESETSDIYARYASVASSNPFSDEVVNRWPRASGEQLAPLTYVPYDSAFTEAVQPREITHSQSENNVRNTTSTNAFGSHSSGTHGTHSSGPFGNDDDLSPVRGRMRSPLKFMDRVREDEDDSEPPPSPTKRSRSPMKKMFGENGWLDRSRSLKDVRGEQGKKSGLKVWSEKFKERVEGLTGNAPKNVVVSSPPKEGVSTQSKLPISLDPPFQSRLYSEMELMICVTANNFLLLQNSLGLMSVDSLLKVTEFWKNKGRPQVLEFQYDQATQRDLVLHNIKHFRFHGPHAGNTVALNSMLYNWKTIAKEMAVRTFCYPDTVVRKHMHDLHKILEMLGAPLSTFLAFQDIQVKALRTMRDIQRKREERAAMQVGVERRWDPPQRVSSDSDLVRGVRGGQPALADALAEAEAEVEAAAEELRRAL
ncbi:MAG: hypothetical protein M1833_000921 [Piccolia ochrophora]|nr:MAG: hypothetical protein M1833_000921 [Piccolia ochrophora]